jgi:hypothetical protein
MFPSNGLKLVMLPFVGEFARSEVAKDNLVLGVDSCAGKVERPCCSLFNLCGGETKHSAVF